MIVRLFEEKDLKILEKIHKQFYPNDSFPDLKNFISSFVIVDDSETIIAFGGIESIVEAVTITNKDFSLYKRAKALRKLSEVLILSSGINGYDIIHAFISEGDPEWIKSLYKVGFRPSKQKVLIKEV